jgi:8-oxo-dGTP pyrophosphatase MutT (NUDIX family)
VALPPHDDLIGGLRARLAEPLPGLPAQLAMSPEQRGAPEQWEEAARRARRAAVLTLLYPLAETGESGLVLTLRQRALKAHSGQVSLPGGRIDPGETPVGAALREGWEEVGVPPEAPQILGPLTDLYIPPSDYTVTPVLAALPERPAFRRQHAEVAALIEVPVAALLDPALRREATWRLGGADVRVPFFALGGYEVWGATAMMLAELAALLEELA